MKQIHSLADEFRAEAAVLRAWGSIAAAEAAETAASRIDAVLREWETETLSVADAATESGYSIAHLRRLVHEGRLQNAGEGRRLKIRRSDLPRKASLVPRKLTQGDPDLASQVLRARGLDMP